MGAPALPPGFVEDDAPPLPAGFSVDPAPPPGFRVDAPRPVLQAPAPRSFRDKLGVVGAAVNEGLVDTLGAPVDLVNAGLGLVGLGSQRPVAGSESIRDLMHRVGFGAADGSAFAPQSVGEQRIASVARGVGQAVVPALGAPALGGRMALSGAPLASSAARQALRASLLESASRPAISVVGELGGGAAAGASGQAAREAFPGNPYADIAAQIIGGAAGGIGAGRLAEYVGPPRLSRPVPRMAAEPPPPEGFTVDQPEGPSAGPTAVPPIAGSPIGVRLRPDVVDPAERARLGLDGTPAADAGATLPPGFVERFGPGRPPLAEPTLATDAPAPPPGLTVDDAAAGTSPMPGAQSTAPRVFDNQTLRALAETGQGVDVQAAGEHLRNAADSALASGGSASLFIEGKEIPIVAPGLRDASGQSWGAMPILSPGAGDNARLVVRPGRGADGADGAAMAGPRPDTLSEAPPLPPGFTEDQVGTLSRLKPLAAEFSTEATRQARDQAVQSFEPGDVTPIRALRVRPKDNRITSLEEADRANPSSIETIEAPDERDLLSPRTLGNTTRRSPADLVTWLRGNGGLKDSGGELAHLGIGNKPRTLDFARNENFVGRLIDDQHGMSLDQAAHKAWEAGFFPGETTRPTIAQFLDALEATNSGRARVFHPDDLDELHNFYTAQGERGRIEGAGYEGAPLAERRGQPVTAADLDGMTPPPEAYAIDVPMPKELAGNIRLDKLDSPQSIDRALTAVSAKLGGFDEARRGIMRQDQTRALASEMGMTPEQLLKRRAGQALNAEQALAARQLLAKSANELVALAKRTAGGTDADLAAFREAMVRHAAIQEQVAGMTAEAGRLLAQFRMVANSRDAVRGPVIRGELLKSIIEGAGGREALEDLAKKVEGAEKPEEINQLTKKALHARALDVINEVWVNALLSGPKTHLTNIAGNLLTDLWTLPEKAMAAGIGSAMRSADRITLGEVGARSVGMLQGARDGLKLAYRTFRYGIPSDAVSKVDANQYRAIPASLARWFASRRGHWKPKTNFSRQSRVGRALLNRRS